MEMTAEEKQEKDSLLPYSKYLVSKWHFSTAQK